MYVEFLTQKLRKENIDLGGFETDADNDSQNKYKNRTTKKN